MRMTVTAVVFDLDGTLVDTLPDLHAALRRLLGELGLAAPSAAATRAMIGDGARKLVERALLASRRTLTESELDLAHARFLELYNAEPCRDSRLFANAEAAVARLVASGIALGVCTNKPQRPSEAILRALAIDRHFRTVVGGDVVAQRKPHPDHVREVLAGLAAAPEGAVMVGDSKNDVLAARGCGMRCILVDFGYSAEPVASLGADLVIGDLGELEAALQRL
jgi:phosphoglycolate phosphatase